MVENWKKERSCVWLILLFCDNDRHMKALETIKKNYTEYAYIKHLPEQDEKKEHYHVVVRFKNYRWNTALAEELDIEINMFEKVRGLDNALLYLVHAREEEKIQYDVSDVQGVFGKRLQRLIASDGKDSTDIAIDIVNWINNQDKEITIHKLFQYCVANGLYSELIRSFKLFECIVRERNEVIRES